MNSTCSCPAPVTGGRLELAGALVSFLILVITIVHSACHGILKRKQLGSATRTVLRLRRTENGADDPEKVAGGQQELEGKINQIVNTTINISGAIERVEERLSGSHQNSSNENLSSKGKQK